MNVDDYLAHAYGPNYKANYSFYEIEAFKDGWYAAVEQAKKLLEDFGTAVVNCEGIPLTTQVYDSLAKDIERHLLTSS